MANLEKDKYEIFITDLKPEIQEEVIEFLGENGNYDVFPMITLWKEEGDPNTPAPIDVAPAVKEEPKEGSFGDFLTYADKTKPAPSKNDFDFGSYAASITDDVKKN